MLVLLVISVALSGACMLLAAASAVVAASARDAALDARDLIESANNRMASAYGELQFLNKHALENGVALKDFMDRWTLPNSVYPAGSELPPVPSEDATPVVTKKKRAKK